MKHVKLVVVMVLAAFAGTALVAQAKPKKAAVTQAADTLTWKEFDPNRPGARIAEISGDRTKGAWKAFVKYPPGAKAGLHTHGSDLELVVVSGTFMFGETPETQKAYGPGSYLFVPAGMPHANGTPDGATLYEVQPGKFDTKPIAAK